MNMRIIVRASRPPARSQNVVVYAGSHSDRAVIRDTEFRYPAGAGAGRQPRVNVLLTSYEVVLKDKSVFKNIHWQTVIIDEAHRMKVRTIQASIAEPLVGVVYVAALVYIACRLVTCLDS